VKVFESLDKIIPFLYPYPLWVKAVLSVWVLLTAVSIVLVVFLRSPAGDTTRSTLATVGYAKGAVSIVTAPSVEQLRAKNGVRELLPLENGIGLTRLPNGVYGFTVPWIINSDPSGVVGGTGSDRISLDRTSGGTGVMEVQKSGQGEVYIVGYVSQERLVRMQDPSNTKDESVPLFFAPYNEFKEPVAVPLRRVVSSNNRTVESIYVNDIVFR